MCARGVRKSEFNFPNYELLEYLNFLTIVRNSGFLEVSERWNFRSLKDEISKYLMLERLNLASLKDGIYGFRKMTHSYIVLRVFFCSMEPT